MVNPDNSVFLKHIFDSCLKVEKFVGNLSYEQFLKDEKTVSAVLRELSVIGEAARKTSDNFRLKNSLIPWENIFGMRNKIIHDYMGVQLSVVWQTAKEDVPELRTLVEEILKND
jgi:uncharacterized protein with HEPN domain